jgi:hypothetical protein
VATSGRIETGRYNGTCFYFQWQLGGQDVGTNRSVIYWQVGINITNNARWYSNAVRLNITTANGSGNIASGVWSNISGNGDHQLGGGIMDIYHNSDGGKAFSAGMSGSLYGSGALETSGGWELPAIPRASSPTFTKGLYTVGEPIAVNMNKKHWSFHHNVSIQIPDGAEIKRQDGFVGDQYVWTPSQQEIDTIYERMKNTRQTSLGVDTWTFNGGSMIGSGFQNVTIAVNDKEAAPLFSKIDARDTNATSKAVTGNDRVFIQGISTVVATIADADKMKTRLKATPKSYTIKLVDKTATIAHDEKQNGKPYEAELGTISQKGSQRLVIQATDSRGLTAEAFKDLNFIEYDTPKITATAERKNNFENETKLSVSGTFARITVDGADKNRIEPDSLRYRWKQDDNGWTAWIKRDFTQSEGAFTMTPAFLSMANSSKFIIEIEVRDKLSTSKTQISLDRGVPIMMISSSNRNVGIGKMPAEGRALDVKGKIYMNEKPLETPTRVRSFRALGLREIEAEVASELPSGYIRKYVDVTQNQQLPSAHFVYGIINWGRAQTVGAHMTAPRSGYYEIAVAEITLNNHNRLGGDRMAVIALDLPAGEYNVDNAFYNAIAIVSQHAGSLPVMASRRVFIKKGQNISIFAGTMASEEGFYKIQLVEWEGDLSEDI